MTTTGLIKLDFLIREVEEEGGKKGCATRRTSARKSQTVGTNS